MPFTLRIDYQKKNKVRINLSVCDNELIKFINHITTMSATDFSIQSIVIYFHEHNCPEILERLLTTIIKDLKNLYNFLEIIKLETEVNFYSSYGILKDEADQKSFCEMTKKLLALNNKTIIKMDIGLLHFIHHNFLEILHKRAFAYNIRVIINFIEPPGGNNHTLHALSDYIKSEKLPQGLTLTFTGTPMHSEAEILLAALQDTNCHNKVKFIFLLQKLKLDQYNVSEEVLDNINELVKQPFSLKEQCLRKFFIFYHKNTFLPEDLQLRAHPLDIPDVNSPKLIR